MPTKRFKASCTGHGLSCSWLWLYKAVAEYRRVTATDRCSEAGIRTGVVTAIP